MGNLCHRTLTSNKRNKYSSNPLFHYSIQARKTKTTATINRACSNWIHDQERVFINACAFGWLCSGASPSCRGKHWGRRMAGRSPGPRAGQRTWGKREAQASSAPSPGKQLYVRCLRSVGPGETRAIKNKGLYPSVALPGLSWFSAYNVLFIFGFNCWQSQKH